MSAVAPPKIANTVRKAFEGEDGLQDLLEVGRAVENLMASPGWTVITNIIEAELSSLDKELDGQKVLAYEEYANLHGRRGGLRAYQQAAEAIVQHAQDRRRRAEEAIDVAGESATER